MSASLTFPSRPHTQAPVDCSDSRLIDSYPADLAQSFPDRLAVADGPRRLSYAEFDLHIRQAAGGLRRLGVEKGDVVSWQLPNWVEALVLHHATLRLGAVSNPIVPIYREREVAFILRQTRSRVFAIPERFRAFEYPRMLAEIREGLPDLVHVVVARSNPSFAGLRYEDLLVGNEAEDVERSPEDPAILLYTSGTTADPKGVVHPHVTLDHENRSIIDLYGLTERDVVFMPSPLTHITGLLYGMQLPAMLGTSVVLLDVWDPGVALALIEEHRCAFAIAATPFLHGLTNHERLPERDVSSLRVFGCGGADVPPELVRQATKRMSCMVTRIYGSTEFPTATSCNAEDPLHKRTTTDGRPIGAVELRVVGDDGCPLSANQEGELHVRGPEMFWGYLADPTGELAFDPDGWFATGDMALLDEDGYLIIRGRKKDIILRGGENISVKEVEDLMFTHPAIREVAVVAMPDPVMVERACAFVVLEDGATLSLDDITVLLREAGLAIQKVPERLAIIDELPKNLAGKVQKFKLRDRARAMASTSAGPQP